MNLTIDPKYGEIDADTLMFLRHFDEPDHSDILEVGSHEEHSADILTDNGYIVTGYDLRPRLGVKYFHFARDFVKEYEWVKGSEEHVIPYDVALSTSAIEHFGLPCYDNQTIDPDYDIKAVEGMYGLLKPGGHCYVTVPYGARFACEQDWRVYDRESLQRRIVQGFEVLVKLFFKSGDTVGQEIPNERVWDGVPIVSEQDADRYDNPQYPHLTVFIKMRKPK